jgi:hypothetical protein
MTSTEPIVEIRPKRKYATVVYDWCGTPSKWSDVGVDAVWKLANQYGRKGSLFGRSSVYTAMEVLREDAEMVVQQLLALSKDPVNVRVRSTQ